MKTKELKEILTKEILFDLYVTQCFSMSKIGTMYKVNVGVVRYLLEHYGIKAQDRAEFHKGRRKQISRDELYDLYVTRGLSKTETAKSLNTSVFTVSRSLKLFGIEDHNKVEVTEDDIKEFARLYEEEQNSLHTISVKTGVSKSKIRNCLVDMGIQFRDKSSCQLSNINSKEKFKSFDVKTIETSSKLRQRCKSFIKQLNIKIKVKRGYVCEECGSTENIHVHHIKPLSSIFNKIIKENDGCTDEELHQIIISHEDVLNESNLKVVCEHCHYTKYHRYMNYHGNQHPSL